MIESALLAFLVSQTASTHFAYSNVESENLKYTLNRTEVPFILWCFVSQSLAVTGTPND